MFQVVKDISSKDPVKIYNVLQVKKSRKFILFLVDMDDVLLWENSSFFKPYITDTRTMPTFTENGTNRSQVFYAATSRKPGYTAYDLIYYDGSWKSIAAEKCIIEGNKLLP